MKFSPKLKVAMEEIKAILAKHDIAGVIVLHTPGFGEFHYKINPSYSIASMKGNAIHIKTDPNDTKEEKREKVRSTANMFSVLTHLTGHAFMNIEPVDKSLKAKGFADNGPGDISGDIDLFN